MDTKFSPVNIQSRKEMDIRPGDTVRVHQKVEEKGKTRIQVFEGIVLARKHGSEPGATFTVRRTSDGIGIEKIFPLFSPVIEKVEIVKRSKVRRAKLYHIREKAAKEIKRQMRNMKMLNWMLEDEEEKTETEEEEKTEGETLKEENAPEENEKTEENNEEEKIDQ